MHLPGCHSASPPQSRVSISSGTGAPNGVLSRISAVVSGAKTDQQNALSWRDRLTRGSSVSASKPVKRSFQPNSASASRISRSAGNASDGGSRSR